MTIANSQAASASQYFLSDLYQFELLAFDYN